MLRQLCGGVVVGGILAVLAAGPAPAQNYPTRPVRVIVPVPAGALTDVITRRITADVAPKLGQPLIIENRPGANFLPAADACKHAAGDGYTLCVFTTSTLTFNPHLINNLSYDPARDFRAVINLGMFIGGMVASPKLAVRNVADLRALAAAQPGKLNFGTYGPASSANVFRQYMSDRWKIDVVEVPYKGANELVAALVAGEIQLTWTALGNWAENPNESKGKIMVMDGTKRSPLISNVPMYQEVDLGDFPIHTWMALFTPAGVPDAIIARLNREFGTVIADPKMTEFLVSQLIEPNVTTADEFSATVARERAATGEMFRRYNIPKIQ